MLELHRDAEKAGYRVSFALRTGSTNNDALKAARAGDHGFHWFVAGAQDQGRGRNARPWVSPPGNLYATLLLINPCAPRFLPQLAFVAALALFDALSESLNIEQKPLLKLKWPNDLLYDQAKMAGILLESVVLADQSRAVMLGFGVNVASHPPDMPYAVTHLAAVEPRISLQTLFSKLSLAFWQRFQQWQAGDDFASIRADWLERAAFIGHNITIKQDQREVTGQWIGLDESGRLQLSVQGDVKTFDAGETMLNNEA
jgi:BirA family transcriptional regulator, biotin operon repressor / biotin---[acetyl-CoA-carboxylase] ligase